MLKKNEYNFPDEEFNLLYQLALKNYPNINGKVSYKSFIELIRNLKREYMKYRTLVE